MMFLKTRQMGVGLHMKSIPERLQRVNLNSTQVLAVSKCYADAELGCCLRVEVW